MNLKCVWKEKLQFKAEAGRHEIGMDTTPPLGSDAAPTPKQLLLAAISGCTGMDVASLLRKHKQPVESFVIEAQAETTEGKHPSVFKSVHLNYRITGQVDAERFKEAVRLSQTQYCGVSAMVSKAVPIFYRIELNGGTIAEGQADFPTLG